MNLLICLATLICKATNANLVCCAAATAAVAPVLFGLWQMLNKLCHSIQNILWNDTWCLGLCFALIFRCQILKLPPQPSVCMFQRLSPVCSGVGESPAAALLVVRLW